MAASSDLDTGVVGDKLFRDADGAWIESGGAAPVLLAVTDRAWNLPMGSRIKVQSVAPVVLTAQIREPVQNDLANTSHWSIITTVGLPIPVATVMGGLQTFAALVRGNPTL